MALFSDCRWKCAQNLLDAADIVREGFITNIVTERYKKTRLSLLLLLLLREVVIDERRGKAPLDHAWDKFLRG